MIRARSAGIWGSLAALAALALAACGDEESGSTTGSGPRASDGILFVQRAEGARLQTRGGEPTLTLNGVDSEVRSFTDRPIRDSGSESVRGFVQRWQQDFQADPPNAALTADEFEHRAEVPVLELTAPVLRAGADTLTYKVRFLTGPRQSGGRFTNVALFIDSLQSGEHAGGF